MYSRLETNFEISKGNKSHKEINLIYKALIMHCILPEVIKPMKGSICLIKIIPCDSKNSYKMHRCLLNYPFWNLHFLLGRLQRRTHVKDSKYFIIINNLCFLCKLQIKAWANPVFFSVTETETFLKWLKKN